MSETVYMNEENRNLIEDLMETGRFSSKSELMNEALQSLQQELVKRDMRQKYDRENPHSPGLEEAQFETLEDAG